MADLYFEGRPLTGKRQGGFIVVATSTAPGVRIHVVEAGEPEEFDEVFLWAMSVTDAANSRRLFVNVGRSSSAFPKKLLDREGPYLVLPGVRLYAGQTLEVYTAAGDESEIVVMGHVNAARLD